MPLIQIDFAKAGPAAPDLAAHLADAARRLTALHLGKAPELTAVVVRPLDPDHWFIGDGPLKPGEASFSLRIVVTGATNTKTEKAAYLAAIWDAFGQLLGRIRTESYIIVEDMPGDAWGYGGFTQERRHIAGQIERERRQAGALTAYATHGIR
jgi:4-oxalocrotonate tautomerase